MNANSPAAGSAANVAPLFDVSFNETVPFMTLAGVVQDIIPALGVSITTSERAWSPWKRTPVHREGKCCCRCSVLSEPSMYHTILPQPETPDLENTQDKLWSSLLRVSLHCRKHMSMHLPEHCRCQPCTGYRTRLLQESSDQHCTEHKPACPKQM